MGDSYEETIRIQANRHREPWIIETRPRPNRNGPIDRNSARENILIIGKGNLRT